MIFDQYQRYKTVEIIVELIKAEIREKSVSILEIGANEECNLEKVLPDDRIKYSDFILTQKMLEDKRFIQVDGCSMPEIADGQYDVVIALDVLEHVPNESREAFINEVNRVAKYVAIICFPYDAIYNVSAEKRVNSYYKMIFGESHKWLLEHIENGLPNINSITSLVQKNKISFKEFYHGDIFIWEEMMKGLFAVYSLSNGGEYYEQIDNLYAQQVYFNDNSKTSYRVFFLMGDNENLLQKISESLEKKYSDTVSEKIYKLMLRSIDELKYQLIRRQERKNVVQHQIYYTVDGSFDEKNKFIITSEEMKDNFICLDIKIAINEKYSAIRFDAIEGEECIIKNLYIVDEDENFVEYKVINGIIEDERIIFKVKDPQIYIDLSNVNTKCIHITGELIKNDMSQELIKYSLNENIDNMGKYVMHDISVSNANVVEEMKNSREKIEEVEKYLTVFMARQDELNERLDKSDEILATKVKQYDEVVMKLNEAFEREKNLIAEKNSWEERCNKMENTLSWKLTSILRKLESLIKKRD